MKLESICQFSVWIVLFCFVFNCFGRGFVLMEAITETNQEFDGF